MSQEAQEILKQITIFGDTAIDWVDFPEAPRSKEEDSTNHCRNLSLEPGTKRLAIGGGAYMLTDFLTKITAGKAHVSGPELENKLEHPDLQKIHSYIAVSNYKAKKDDADIWRISDLNGFSRPAPEECEIEGPHLEELTKSELIVIDDAANGCRHNSKITKRLNKVRSESTTTIYKMSRPIHFRHLKGDPCGIDCAKCSLWTWIKQRYIDLYKNIEPKPKNSKLVVILDAEDLRTEECEISKGLSWERTAVDTVNAFLVDEAEHYDRFFIKKEKTYILACWVIIRFGLDGAVILPPGCNYESASNKDEYTKRAYLVYDRNRIEGQFNFETKGLMTGYSSTLTAIVTNSILNNNNVIDIETILEATKKGLTAARTVLLEGFDKSKSIHPCDTLINASKNSPDKCFQTSIIPYAKNEFHRPIGGWSIITSSGLQVIEKAAMDILSKGVDYCPDKFPIAKFGALTTLDKSEIEGYRNIERLVREYTENTNKKEPLCLAVFGQPGSGKSYGVKQVIKSIINDVEILGFNISEFTSTKQLSRAFHQVTDKTGSNHMPLIFFDEFDSKFGEQSCGWLKYFLAPMNDGEFNDGIDTHPIGRAIFVFAGGTFHQYSEMSNACFKEDMKDAKVPDFVSRLRGHLNILGSNPTHETDYTCMLRRATVLYDNLSRRADALGRTAHWLKDNKNHISINNGVKRAFLKAPHYKNSTRSMVAIMEMSALSNSKGYTKSALPPPYLLEMQVNAPAFKNLVRRDAIFIPSRNVLAKMVHEDFVDEENKKPESDRSPNAIPWAELRGDIKETNRQQIDGFLSFLDARNYNVEIDACIDTSPIAFTNDDVEFMAEQEHERWCHLKRAQGWNDGTQNEKYMVHPDLIPWSELDDNAKAKDRNAINNIPGLLATCRLAITKKVQ